MDLSNFSIFFLIFLFFIYLFNFTNLFIFSDYLFPAIQSFIHQYLGSEPISKMFRALDVCISVDLSIKNKLVPVLLQTLNEIELKKHGTDDSLR